MPARPGFLIAVLIIAGAAGQPPAWSREVPEDLPAKYRAWVEEVDLLLTDEEWKAFLELDKDYQRDGFIARFWQARDPVVRTERNEFKETWYARLDAAREWYGSLEDARSRILLLNDEPIQALEKPCPDVFLPVEMWYYGLQVPDPVVVVFFEPRRDAPYELWDPADGALKLVRDPLEARSQCSARPGFFGGSGSHLPPAQQGEYRCLVEQLASRCPFDYKEIGAYLARVALLEARDFEALRDRLEARPEARDGEWLDTFASYSTDLPQDAPALPARLEVLFPGRRAVRTVVQGVVTVETAEAVSIELADRVSYDFQLTGEVVRNKELFESFRYRFDVPAAEAGEAIPLVFERLLRPGSYELIVKLEDLNSGRSFRESVDLRVPNLDQAAAAPPADPVTARLAEEATRAMTGEDTYLRLVPPEGDLHVGMVRFEARSHGELARVSFFLDGERVLTKNRAPYSVELDLGRIPRVHTVRVAGYGEDGREIAGDEIEVNVGRNRFSVRLVEPRPRSTYRRSLLIRAEVTVPEGSRLDRLELYLDEKRLATLYQPPFEQTLLLDGSGELAYVRARAFLDDGNAAEDVVFVNAPDFLEEVDVRLVELYASVLDGAGHPVEGLVEDDFAVAEDGTPQRILRFEKVEDLPVQVAVLFDASASMAERLDDARRAAVTFLEETITGRDRAAVVTFNDVPRLAVGPTNDGVRLAGAFAALKAEGGTALWDSVVFTLQLMNGVSGQRAILLLTDGEDQSSRFTFDEVSTYAQSAGVALYAVGLGLEAFADARGKLTRLVDATGGRSYFVRGTGELPGIYSEIRRDLRSKYLIVYQSSNTGEGGGFRRVELTVARPKVEVRTLRGYFP